MKETKTVAKKTSWFRVILGTLVAYVIIALIGVLLYAVQMLEIAGPTVTIFVWVLCSLLCFIILLYTYGVLGLWLFDLEWARNVVIRWAGKILSFIGFFLRPFPLMAFGTNKKYLFNLFITVPLAILGIVFIIFGALGVNIFPGEGDWSIFYFISGGFALLNAFLALRARKCPNCGCLMTEIDYDIVSIDKETYTKQYSRNIGYISDGNGNTADVNEIYNVEHEGCKNKYAKTFTCKNCGTQKQGRTHTLHEMSGDDYISHS